MLHGAYNQLHGLVSTDSDRAGDLLVTADAERAHGVSCTAKDWLLTCQLLQHLQISATAVDTHPTSPQTSWVVYLVGAGPPSPLSAFVLHAADLSRCLAVSPCSWCVFYSEAVGFLRANRAAGSV